MPERLPRAARKAVVEGYLYDMTRDEILRTVRRSYKKIGGGSVTNIEREFDDEVNESGLEAAARDFDVSQLVEDLKEVGGFARKNSVSLEDMAEGGKLAVALREHEIPVGDVSRYVLPVYTRLKREDYDADSVAGQFMTLNELLEKYGPFENLKSDYETTAKELADATETLSSLKSGADAKKKEIGNLDKEYGVSLSAAKAYVSAKQRLQSMGLDMDDLGSVEKCLTNLRERKFNPARVIATFNESENLTGRIASQKGQLVSISEEVEGKGRELSRVLAELKKRTGELDEAKLLARAGLEIEAIRQIRDTVELTARKRKVTPPKAVQQLISDIMKNYDTVLGLKGEIERLGSDQRSAQKALEEAGKRVQAQDRLYSARKAQIEAYERLEKKGVDGDILLEWEDAISKSDLDTSTVTAELKKYTSLKRARDTLDEEMREARSKKQTLASEIESLNARKSQLEASIGEVTEKGLKALESHIQNFRTSVAAVEKETLKSVSKTSGEVKDNVGVLEKSVTETVKNVNEVLGAMETKVNGIAKKALQTGQEVQKVQALKPLIDFYERGEGARTDVLQLSSRYVTNLEHWAAAHTIEQVQSEASSLGKAIHNAIVGP